MSVFPLARGWRLFADGLKEESNAFSSFLPGVSRLEAYADLLGVPEDREPEGVPFALPGLLPPEAFSGARLCRELRFGYGFDHVLLCFSMLRGSGCVLLDGEEIERFESGALTLDLSNVARRRHRKTLTVAFDRERPAGIIGPVYLKCARFAWFQDVSLRPEGSAVQGEVVLSAALTGEYLLRITSGSESLEFPLSLQSGETKALPFACPLPPPGRQNAPLISLRLYVRGGPKALAPCDRQALLCGLRREAPKAWIDLSPEETQLAPDVLASSLSCLPVSAVRLKRSLANDAYAALYYAGVSVLHTGQETDSNAMESLSRFPNVFFLPQSAVFPDTAEAAALQLTAPSGSSPSLSAPQARTEWTRMLFGAPLRLTLPRSPFVQLLVRIRADGARMGLFSGPVAPAGSLADPSLSALLRHAAEPHAAAFPLFGAWRCGMHFFCRLGMPGAPKGARLTAALMQGSQALAVYDSEKNRESFLKALLPEEPCVLSLCLALILPDGTRREEAPLPVPVGRRGPLEALLPSLSADTGDDFDAFFFHQTATNPD